MSVALDVASAAQAINGGAISWSHTVAAGSNRYLVVAAGSGGFSGTTWSATCGGVAMTSLAAAATTAFGSGVQGTAQLFGIIAPGTGAQTIVLTPTAGSNVGAAASITYTGVDQSTPTGSPFTNSGSAAFAGDTLTVTGGAAGDMVVDALSMDASAVNPTASQTSRLNTSVSGYSGAAQDAPGGTSVAMGWTWSPNDAFAHVAINLKQSSGAVAVKRMTLLGVG